MTTNYGPDEPIIIEPMEVEEVMEIEMEPVEEEIEDDD